MDFRIYDKNKKTIGLVILGPELHWKLYEKAKELKLSFFPQFKDFYGVRYTPIHPFDFEKLNGELLELCRALDRESGACEFRLEMEALINLGKREGLPIEIVVG